MHMPRVDQQNIAAWNTYNGRGKLTMNIYSSKRKRPGHIWNQWNLWCALLLLVLLSCDTYLYRIRDDIDTHMQQSLLYSLVTMHSVWYTY